MSGESDKKEVEVVDLSSDEEGGEEEVKPEVPMSSGRVTNYKRLVNDLYEMADLIMEGVKRRPEDNQGGSGIAGSVKVKKEKGETLGRRDSGDHGRSEFGDYGRRESGEHGRRQLKEENRRLKGELKEAAKKCGEWKDLLEKAVKIAEENRALKESVMKKDGEIATLKGEVEQERKEVLGRDSELASLKMELERINSGERELEGEIERLKAELENEIESKEEFEVEAVILGMELEEEQKKTREREKLEGEIDRLKMELEKERKINADGEKLDLEGMIAVLKNLNSTMTTDDPGEERGTGSIEQLIEERMTVIRDQVKLAAEKWKRDIVEGFRLELDRTKEVVQILQQRLRRFTVLKQQPLRPQMLALMRPTVSLPFAKNTEQLITADAQKESAGCGVHAVESETKSADRDEDEEKKDKSGEKDGGQLVGGKTATEDNEAAQIDQPNGGSKVSEKIPKSAELSPCRSITKRVLPRRMTSKPVRYLSDEDKEIPDVPAKKGRVELKQQQQTHHGVDEEASKKGVCKCLCGVTFKIKYAMLHHIRSENTGPIFKCKMCPQSFKNHHCLNMHVFRTHRTSYKAGRYSCVICAKTFTTLQQVYKHKEATHKSEEMETPKLKEMTTTKNIDANFGPASSHSPQGPLNCSCGAKFGHKHTLQRHILAQQEGKVFKCSWCSQSFSRKDHLKSHEDKCCKMKFAKSNHHNEDHSSSDQLKCLCGVTFATRGSLRRHIQDIKMNGSGASYPMKTEKDLGQS